MNLTSFLRKNNIIDKNSVNVIKKFTDTLILFEFEKIIKDNLQLKLLIIEFESILIEFNETEKRKLIFDEINIGIFDSILEIKIVKEKKRKIIDDDEDDKYELIKIKKFKDDAEFV